MYLRKILLMLVVLKDSASQNRIKSLGRQPAESESAVKKKKKLKLHEEMLVKLTKNKDIASNENR